MIYYCYHKLKEVTFMKVIYICGKCGNSYSNDAGRGGNYCDDCKIPLVETKIELNDWKYYDSVQKDDARRNVMEVWAYRNTSRDAARNTMSDEEMRARAQAEREKQQALKNILITSGFNFDGYKVVKYSGYISGDDVVEVERGTTFLGMGATHTGSALTESLVKIRRRALQELKEAAYDLGCNAVIGVDFDYITLEPETASLGKHTTYLPYVFCVTANGNAVVIEKEEQKQSAASILKEYEELLDSGIITWEEFEMKKRELL